MSNLRSIGGPGVPQEPKKPVEKTESPKNETSERIEKLTGSLRQGKKTAESRTTNADFKAVPPPKRPPPTPSKTMQFLRKFVRSGSNMEELIQHRHDLTEKAPVGTAMLSSTPHVVQENGNTYKVLTLSIKINDDASHPPLTSETLIALKEDGSVCQVEINDEGKPEIKESFNDFSGLEPVSKLQSFSLIPKDVSPAKAYESRPPAPPSIYQPSVKNEPAKQTAWYKRLPIFGKLFQKTVTKKPEKSSPISSDSSLRSEEPSAPSPEQKDDLGPPPPLPPFNLPDTAKEELPPPTDLGPPPAPPGEELDPLSADEAGSQGIKSTSQLLKTKNQTLFNIGKEMANVFKSGGLDAIVEGYNQPLSEFLPNVLKREDEKAVSLFAEYFIENFTDNREEAKAFITVMLENLNYESTIIEQGNNRVDVQLEERLPEEKLPPPPEELGAPPSLPEEKKGKVQNLRARFEQNKAESDEQIRQRASTQVKSERQKEIQQKQNEAFDAEVKKRETKAEGPNIKKLAEGKEARDEEFLKKLGKAQRGIAEDDNLDDDFQQDEDESWLKDEGIS